MRQFTDASGGVWSATAQEESTPRHHGRWVLVFHPADDPAAAHSMPEVRWQTKPTALRTLATMSELELRRRLGVVLTRRSGPKPLDDPAR